MNIFTTLSLFEKRLSGTALSEPKLSLYCVCCMYCITCQRMTNITSSIERLKLSLLRETKEFNEKKNPPHSGTDVFNGM